MDYKKQIFKLLRADVWKGWYYSLFILWIFAIWIISVATIFFLATLNQYYPIPETNLNSCIYGFNLISYLETVMVIYLALAVTIDLILWFDERKMNKVKLEKTT